jgi:N-acetylneuraminic acid mutarotase
MKKQLVRPILSHLWRGALFLVLPVVVILIMPIAFGQRNAGKSAAVSQAPAVTGAAGVVAPAGQAVPKPRPGMPALSGGAGVSALAPGLPNDSWAVRMAMPYVARGPFAVSDGTVVYVGGGYDGTNVHTDLLKYDPVANTYTALAPSPDGHFLSQAVIFNNKIYNIAGFALGVQTQTTRIYDIPTNTWSTGAPIPEANGLTDHAIGLSGSKIYIAGGYNGAATSTLRIYDIPTNTWTTGAPLPVALFLPGFGVINGKLYVAGGSTGTGELNTLYIYDIASNTWTTGAVLPTPVLGPGSAVANGKLYLFGGGHPFPTTINTTQIYDPATNMWTTGPNMNVARVWFYGGSLGCGIVAPGGDTTPGAETATNEQLTIMNCSTGCNVGPWATATPYPTSIVRYGFAQTATHFFVFGGVSDGTAVNNVNRMDISTGMWQTRTAMPFTSEAPTCALMPGTNFVYCAQGTGGSGFARYDRVADTWTTLANTPNANNYGSASGAFNGKVFLAGGNPVNAINNVWVYDVATNTWSTGTAAPAAFFLAGYQEVGQYLYVVGGFSGTPDGSARAASSVLHRGEHPDVVEANQATTWRLDMSSAPGAWSNGPAFTPQRADFGLAYDACGNKLYALGGDATGGTFFDSVNLVDELSVASWPAGSWAASTPLINQARQANQAGFSNGGTIWSVGGIVGQTFTFLAEVQKRTVCCGCPLNVLIVYADSTGAPTQLQSEVLAESGVTAVDLFDGAAGTPTLAQLQAYKIVVPFSNTPFSDATTLGNNLADYVDGGGIVVQHGFSFYGPAQPYGVNGRWVTGNYNPYDYSTNLVSSAFTLGTFNAGHPLMAGVTTLNSNYQNVVTPAAGATQVAAASNGNSLVAYRPVGTHTTVGVTAYVGTASTQSGDWGKVIVNAARWLGTGCGPTALSAVSRITHSGGCGTFDVNMPLNCPTGVEDRSTGGNYTLVVTFDSAITAVTSASVTCHNPGSGTGTAGAPTFSGSTVTVPLTGVSDGQALTVHIVGVTSASGTVNVDVPFGVLVGDTNASRSVSAADVSQTKAQSGNAVTAANFREDVNANCAISASDVSIVKARLGVTTVPACCP